MTWYAGHIYAEPTPAVIDALASSDALADHLYLVADLADHNWFKPEIAHNLPTGGLLVGREVCELGSHQADWHGDDAVLWDGRTAPFTIGPVIVGPPDMTVLEPSAEAFAPADDYLLENAFYSFPPIEFLRLLKWVSSSTNTVVSFYHCSMWGGDVEVEYSWVFGHYEVVYGLTATNTITEYRASGTRTVQGDVLVLTMRHHDLELPTQYSALLARGFPWHKYKLSTR